MAEKTYEVRYIGPDDIESATYGFETFKVKDRVAKVSEETYASMMGDPQKEWVDADTKGAVTTGRNAANADKAVDARVAEASARMAESLAGGNPTAPENPSMRGI